jgi:probable phosphomutase (TIGR03848 family)
MHEIFLIRHGRSTANNKGVLAGRLPGIELDEVGVKQASAVAQYLTQFDIKVIYSSPLERCINTAKIIKEPHKKITKISIDKNFLECDYGSWSGKKISKLSILPLWKIIQKTPSQVTFPKGESMLEMANRANNGLLKILEEHKKKPIKIAIVSHADVIKAVLAFAMGLHLDNFQRLIVDPASISKINWNKGSFYVDYINQKSHLSEISSKTNAPSGAVLGGGAG